MGGISAKVIGRPTGEPPVGLRGHTHRFAVPQSGDDLNSWVDAGKTEALATVYDGIARIAVVGAVVEPYPVVDHIFFAVHAVKSQAGGWLLGDA